MDKEEIKLKTKLAFLEKELPQAQANCHAIMGAIKAIKDTLADWGKDEISRTGETPSA